MGKPYVNGHKKKPPPKKILTMMAEAEFFDRLDTLCEAESPPVSRAYMLRKLVFEKSPMARRVNGHDRTAKVPA